MTTQVDVELVKVNSNRWRSKDRKHAVWSSAPELWHWGPYEQGEQKDRRNRTGSFDDAVKGLNGSLRKEATKW